VVLLDPVLDHLPVVGAVVAVAPVVVAEVGREAGAPQALVQVFEILVRDRDGELGNVGHARPPRLSAPSLQRRVGIRVWMNFHVPCTEEMLNFSSLECSQCSSVPMLIVSRPGSLRLNMPSSRLQFDTWTLASRP